MGGASLVGQPKLPLAFKRPTQTERVLRAGCYVCHGDVAHWTAANAQVLAAKHHDGTNHVTWVEIDSKTQYGRTAADPRQIDIEDAIASASSGDAPVCAPFPDLDAPAVTAADVSIPQGRPVETRRSRARVARGRKPEALHA